MARPHGQPHTRSLVQVTRFKGEWVGGAETTKQARNEKEHPPHTHTHTQHTHTHTHSHTHTHTHTHTHKAFSVLNSSD